MVATGPKNRSTSQSKKKRAVGLEKRTGDANQSVWERLGRRDAPNGMVGHKPSKTVVVDTGRKTKDGKAIKESYPQVMDAEPVYLFVNL